MTFRPSKTWGSSKTVFPFENSFGSAFHYDCLGWLWWWFGCENFLHNIVLSAIKVCRQQTLISIKLCIKKGKEENTQIYLYLDLQGRFSCIPASVHYQRLGIPYVLYCRSLIKVKFSSDKVRRALGSCGCSSINWLIVTMLKKPENGPISDLFNLTPKYFLPLLPYTDLVPPSTDPVPPSTNQYRPILTQYHHGSTITALYWSIATMYQQVEPHTDPVPSCINQYRLLLTQ